jgi:hypothetical protein
MIAIVVKNNLDPSNSRFRDLICKLIYKLWFKKLQFKMMLI